jgi:hypothetical protein
MPREVRAEGRNGPAAGSHLHPGICWYGLHYIHSYYPQSAAAATEGSVAVNTSSAVWFAGGRGR